MAKRRANRPPPLDPGMQPERTTLSWERTGFSLVVVGAVMARYGFEDGYMLEAASGSVVILGGTIATLWAAHHYSDDDSSISTGINPAHPVATRMLGITAIVASLGGLAMAVRIVIANHNLF